jgi:hypothetical protein
MPRRLCYWAVVYVYFIVHGKYVDVIDELAKSTGYAAPSKRNLVRNSVPEKSELLHE